MSELDDLFAVAAAQPVPAPSDALMAGVLADAAREQARPAARLAVLPARPGVWSAMSALFGGSGVLAGLGTAAVAGLYLGFAQPSALLQLTDAFGGGTSLDGLDLMPGVDALLSEE